MKKQFLSNRFSVVILLMFFFISCEKDQLEVPNVKEASDSEAKVVTKARGGSNTPAEEIVGNNLSFPVIWSDGITKTVPGTYGEETFNGLYFTAVDADGQSYDYYIQGDPGNTWQAESFDPTQTSSGEADPLSNSPVNISSIDWGDNLEAKDWPFGSQIRVEVVLYKDLLRPMIGYQMKIEDESQSGLTEIWGAKTENSQGETAGVTYEVDSATVYSGMAKLVIQKLIDLPEGQTRDLSWNSEGSYWEGDAGIPLFEGGVWEGNNGPSGYSAEINVQGKIIYGYNWVTRKIGDGEGTYRLTFVLDNNFTGTRNTFFDTSTKVVAKAEEEIITEEEPDSGGGTAVILPDENLSYIDVQLLPKSGSGGGNSGAGGGNGGNPGGGHGGQGPRN